MKKIFSLIVLFFVVFTSTNAYSYYSNEFNTYNTEEKIYSYDYYFDTNVTKKYNFDKNSREINKFCFYKEDWKTKILANWETKILKTSSSYREKYKKVFCDNWSLKTIFKWKKIIKMACTFSVNNHKYVIQDGETKIIKTNYYNTTISQKFICNNWKVTKLDEWLGKKLEKRSCYFVYNNKIYTLNHSAYTTLKVYENDHLVYKKYVCNNWELNEYSTWRNIYNNSKRELTSNCRFIYRGKYYDLQNNWIKEFTTTIYTNWIKKIYYRKYYCENWVTKIYK